MKYINYIILVVLLCIGFIFKEHINISSNLASLLITEESAQKIKIASNLGYSKELLVAVKDFGPSSKKSVESIAKELRSIDGIISVQSTLEPSIKVQEYYKQFYPLLATFDDKQQTREKVQKKLQTQYDAQLSSIFYTPINQNDPLGLFTLNTNLNKRPSHRGAYIVLDDYGYLIRVRTKVEPSQMNESKLLYAKCQAVFSKYDNIIAFSPFFYTVENSNYIQKDIQKIIIISVVILLILYYFLLKNISLLMETLTALSSSILFATLVSTMFFKDFHILSLAFGMSISAVSIDYLLHYYFHGFYQSKNSIDKNVFYGFLTTVIAFGIFAFVPIALISQISFFTALSLVFAYILFTFIFPMIRIKAYKGSPELNNALKRIPAFPIFILSLILIFYSAKNIQFDNNIRNLDYQNISLMEKETFFKKAFGEQLKPVVVQAESQEQLLNNLHELHQKTLNSFSLASFVLDKRTCLNKLLTLKSYDFNTLKTMINEEATKIGYKKDYFENSYRFAQNLPSCDIENFDIFDTYNIGMYRDGNTFFAMAFVSEINIAESFTFVTSIDLQKLFLDVAQQMYENLLLYSILVVLVIFIFVVYSARKKFLYALNYILFPLSLTLALLVSLVDINLMHLFALIILIAIGIDYGIYMSNTAQRSKTVLAIRYSLLSTFAGFGVLIFSSVVALNSIGIVISLGLLSIFILIRVMK